VTTTIREKLESAKQSLALADTEYDSNAIDSLIQAVDTLISAVEMMHERQGGDGS
jgi:hypothetical protein